MIFDARATLFKQKDRTISYDTVRFRTIPYDFVRFRTISYEIVRYRTKSYDLLLQIHVYSRVQAGKEILQRPMHPPVWAKHINQDKSFRSVWPQEMRDYCMAETGKPHFEFTGAFAGIDTKKLCEVRAATH